MKETFLCDGWEFIETQYDRPLANLGYSNPEWMSAVVPGHVHLDLITHGIIPDPHERMHEYGVQWVDETEWSYRCRFDWQPDDSLPHRVLRFEGLDTICTITLNGVQIGQSENMFLPLEIDVRDHLKVGENELRIDFASAAKVGRELEQKFFAEEGLPSFVERFEERSFIRKIQCMYGWDWGPRLISCGIWKPVQLIEFRSRITHLSAIQEWQPDGSVILKSFAETQGDCAIDFLLELEDETLQSSSGVFHIENPELWWPVGCGEQPLFGLTAGIRHADSQEFDDLQTIQVGFRQVRLLREKDEIGESFEFEVNGKKVYAKGFNWIPDYSFPSALTRADYEERLLQAVDLGSNMLRVWGGGMYESEDFYDLCDELGIMVWQDFPQACAYYPDTDEWLEKVRPEAEYHVKRLRSRASLSLWCGNNENLQMWQQKWKWKGGEHPPRFYGERLYNELFPSVLAEHFPGHNYVATSPIGESEPDCNGGKIGDSHYWDAWHGRGDWKYYLDSEARFSSEYGFASSCSLALWEETISEEDWNYRGLNVRWHDKTRKGYDTFVGYVELHYPESQSLEDWVYFSQLNQRDALRMGVEHFRRNAFCRGSLIWQLNDIWPVQSWAVIDSSGRYKAAAFEMPRLYGNELFSFERVKDKIRVHYVDDRIEGEELPVSFIASAIHLGSGEESRTWSLDGMSQPGQRQVLGELDLNGLSVPDTLVFGTGAEGQAWHLLGEPKEMRFATPSKILASNASLGESGILSLRVDGPVVDLMLSVDGDTAPFHQNFITLPGAGVYEIEVDGFISHFEARSLAGEHTVTLTRSPIH